MYRNFLRLLSALCLLFTFWPVFRFSGVTIFDWLTLIVIVFALPYTPKERGAPFSSFRLATYGIVALAFAFFLPVYSAQFPVDPDGFAARIWFEGWR